MLSNKLVLYNLENQAIGWTKYNCEYHELCVSVPKLVARVR